MSSAVAVLHAGITELSEAKDLRWLGRDFGEYLRVRFLAGAQASLQTQKAPSHPDGQVVEPGCAGIRRVRISEVWRPPWRLFDKVTVPGNVRRPPSLAGSDGVRTADHMQGIEPDCVCIYVMRA